MKQKSLSRREVLRLSQTYSLRRWYTYAGDSCWRARGRIARVMALVPGLHQVVLFKITCIWTYVVIASFGCRTQTLGGGNQALSH